MRYYGFVRLGLFYGIIFLPFLVLTIKQTRISKLRIVILFFLFFLVGIASFASRWFPVENYFINFKSPENVLTYYSGTVEEIIDVVNGEHSCLVFYEPYKTSHSYTNMKNGNYPLIEWYSHNVIHRSTTGYKLPSNISKMPYYTKRTRYNLDEDGVFYAYHVEGTNDYYLYGITKLVGNECDVVYGYSNSLDDLKCNLKRVHVTIREDGLPHWMFVE